MYKFPSILTTLAVSYLGFTLVIMLTAAVFKNIVKTCTWCLTYTYYTPSESHDGILNQTYQFICYKKVPCSIGIYSIFPLRQFPLCQCPLCQFPFGQLPTLSIPILSIPIWSMLTKRELTKWEVGKVGTDEVHFRKI